MPMPGEEHVAFFALGGTIAMASAEGGGVVARLGAAELLQSLGDAISQLPIPVRAHDPRAVPSASLRFTDVLALVDAAAQAVADGAVGVVLAQGTDTLEETAFLIDSVWSSSAPFVLTGAMRNPTMPGHDGPANLLSALQVANDPAARDRGALLVFADQIHTARHVRKTHTTSTATFVSPDLGPVGYVIEDRVRFLADAPKRTAITGWTPESIDATKIALYTTTLDDDGLLLAGPSHSHHGLIIAALGAGHVPAQLLDVLDEINAVMPVVLTSRVGAGSVLEQTYAAPGAERDLLARGLINGRFVHPYKARILLRLLVASGADRAEIGAAFAALG